MPTYRRREQLRLTLRVLAGQSRMIDHLVVVDNGGDVDPADLDLDTPTPAARRLTLLPQTANLGPAGALEAGLRFVLDHAGPEDRVLALDDDDPPRLVDTVEQLWSTADRLAVTDPRFGAVGIGGAAFDARRVRTMRLRDEDLRDEPLPIDVLTGNHLPMIQVAAVRDVGPYRGDLFFGFDDLEFFLRLRRRGWQVYCDGALTRRQRAFTGRSGASTIPSRRLGPADWRRYYSIRNLVFIARHYAGVLPTARLVAALLGKVAANALGDPRAAAAHSALTVRACAHGLSGRLGRSWEPDLAPDGRLPSITRRSLRARP